MLRALGNFLLQGPREALFLMSKVPRQVIPMGGPLPVLGQPTVAYGAAAVMVHPASGILNLET